MGVPRISLRPRSLSRLLPHVPLCHRLCRRPDGAEGDRHRCGRAAGRSTRRQPPADVAVCRAAQRHGAQAVQAMVDALCPEAGRAQHLRAAASLALILLFWQWRPIPTVVWHVANPAVAMAIMGAVVRRLAAGADLDLPDQPLRAVRAASGREQPRRPRHAAARFKTPVLYKLVRHPIYLGFIIAFWAAPTMTVGHLLFAAVTTAYIFVGILLEERDLVAVRRRIPPLQRRVSMLIPWRKSA